MLDEREPDSEPGMAARRAGVGLPKSLEEMGHLVRRDALAGVAHHDLDVRVHAPKAQLNSAALRRELHRIDEEIPHHLLDAAGIAHDRGGPRIKGGVEPNALRGRRRPDRVERGLQWGEDIHGPDVQPHVPGDHTRDIKQVLDQLHLDRRIAEDRLGRVPHRRRVKATALQHPSPSIDGVQGRPQFVRQRREELVLAAIEVFGFRASGLLTLEERLPSVLEDALRRDVARDLRSADDGAPPVSYGRHRNRHIEELTVLALTDGLEVVNAVAPPKAREHPPFFLTILFRDDQGDVLPDGLGGSPSKDALRGAVPGRDHPIERLADDRIFRGLDDRRQAGLRDLTPSALRDIAGYLGGPDDATGRVFDG